MLLGIVHLACVLCQVIKFVYSVAIDDAPEWVQRSRDGIAAMKYGYGVHDARFFFVLINKIARR